VGRYAPVERFLDPTDIAGSRWVILDGGASWKESVLSNPFQRFSILSNSSTQVR
jgi:hypothetical protein